MGLAEIITIWISSNFDDDPIDIQGHPNFSSDHSAIHMGKMVTGKPAMRSFSDVMSHILVGGLAISLLLGSYFKCVYYRGMFKEKFFDRPINILLLLGAVIHHSTHLFAGINLIVTISFDVSLGETMGIMYCQLELWIGTFGLAYLSIGSLGIALYRVLYLKYDHWTKYVVGEKLLLGIIVIGGLMITACLATLFMIETSSKRVIINGCIGQSQLAQSIHIEVKKRQGMRGILFLIIGMRNYTNAFSST